MASEARTQYRCSKMETIYCFQMQNSRLNAVPAVKRDAAHAEKYETASFILSSAADSPWEQIEFTHPDSPTGTPRSGESASCITEIKKQP